MNVLCCIKQVPDTQAAKKINERSFRLDRDAVEGVLNPFDEYSIEEGLKIVEAQGGAVSLLCMGPPRAETAIRKALAMGAERAVHVCDEALAGSDSLVTAQVLAAAVSRLALPFDLLLFAAQTTDASTGQVPAMVAELLGLPMVTSARRLIVAAAQVSAHRDSDGGYQVVQTSLPAVASVTKAINQPRYPSLKGIMAAKKKEVRRVGLAELGIAASEVGSGGSQSRVSGLSYPEPRKPGQVVRAEANGHTLIADFLAQRNLL